MLTTIFPSAPCRPVSYANAAGGNYAAAASAMPPRGAPAARGRYARDVPAARGGRGGAGPPARPGGPPQAVPPHITVPNEDFDFEQAHEKFDKTKEAEKIVEK